MTLAKNAGAECAKFQHFRAEHIVSDHGFKPLGGQQSHQAPWKWTASLAAHAESIGIKFMSASYDLEAVEHLNPYVNAFKLVPGM